MAHTRQVGLHTFSSLFCLSFYFLDSPGLFSRYIRAGFHHPCMQPRSNHTPGHFHVRAATQHGYEHPPQHLPSREQNHFTFQLFPRSCCSPGFSFPLLLPLPWSPYHIHPPTNQNASCPCPAECFHMVLTPWPATSMAPPIEGHYVTLAQGRL